MLTKSEYELLVKAILINSEPNAQPHPERDEAIQELLKLDGERLRAVIAFAVSDELIPGYEEMGHQLTPLYQAVLQFAGFTAKECLELVLAISKSINGDDDLAELLYNENVRSAIRGKLPPLPYDAFVLFRSFLHGFEPTEFVVGEEPAIASYWAFTVAQLLNWGHLNVFISQVSADALNESLNKLEAWHSLITARMAYINHKE